jgi:hypothetical protein
MSGLPWTGLWSLRPRNEVTCVTAQTGRLALTVESPPGRRPRAAL